MLCKGLSFSSFVVSHSPPKGVVYPKSIRAQQIVQLKYVNKCVTLPNVKH